jgi:hypothetical protein
LTVCRFARIDDDLFDTGSTSILNTESRDRPIVNSKTKSRVSGFAGAPLNGEKVRRAAERELIDPNRDGKRYVRRDGTLNESDQVSRSLAADRKTVPKMPIVCG